ncbi:hypothetical protein NDU88_012129, partial [Pleurodeles waltl]
QEEWEEAVVEDEEYCELRRLICDPDSSSSLPHESLRQYLEVRNELSIQGEKILRRGKVVPPRKLRVRLIKLVHEGHLGRSLTKRRLRQFYW